MADVVSKKVALSVADGSSMEAFVARPAGPGPFPGLLLFQEAFGVNFHIRDVAHRFARERLVVIAPELFHRTAPAGLEIPYDDFPQAAPHLKALTPEAIKLDARAAYDWLTSQPNVRRERIACVGFCMGGRVSFLANASLPLQAAVSFYGGGIAPSLLSEVPNLHATMLFFWGGLDKHIGQDQIRPLMDTCNQIGKAFVNVEVSNADHGFFCDARPSYNAEAAELGWKLTLSFLDLHIIVPEKRTRVR
jgi:carboxymethylenebutenolidase